jgi:hypothetical protein
MRYFYFFSAAIFFQFHFLCIKGGNCQLVQDNFKQKKSDSIEMKKIDSLKDKISLRLSYPIKKKQPGNNALIY